MNLKETQDTSFIPITLISNGSYELYNENSLTFFSNQLHKAIKLDPSLHHYAALQEIGVSLNSENIPTPYDKPTLIYIKWNINIFEGLEVGKSFNIDTIDKLKAAFIASFNIHKEKTFINYPNDLGVYSVKRYLEKAFYTPLMIEKWLKNYENIFNKPQVRITFDFVC